MELLETPPGPRLALASICVGGSSFKPVTSTPLRSLNWLWVLENLLLIPYIQISRTLQIHPTTLSPSHMAHNTTTEDERGALSPIRIGLVGYGMVNQVFHAPYSLASPNVARGRLSTLALLCLDVDPQLSLLVSLITHSHGCFPSVEKKRSGCVFP